MSWWMKLKPTAQVKKCSSKKKIENREQNKQIYGSIYILNSIWSIQYCIDRIEFVNRKKNWKKEMIKNIKKDRYIKLYLSF